ncbi:MAG TPA: nitronate monooxygenase [Salinivirga sp.]|uniref:NAD(P)H-dependent flavin oxidoreductase n=1 Tax=Salinivirga sp. TaxID=1970192 RepID=UPI002B45E46E|nr:nitronate monooxygenase [Salinivirga sp.]HKK58816.1 nitronate monooxygenase [Salinivirga sp.]
MKTLDKLLNIKYPLLLSPMFMVTNENMVAAAIDAGATGALVAHNYRSSEALRNGIRNLKSKNRTPFGVNLTLDFGNELFHENLQVCAEEQVDFIITSLGDPKEVIDKVKPLGVRVFCDVIHERHAAKAVERGADALIAVNKDAGGHAGIYTAEELISDLKARFDIPVISAGGVSSSEEMKKVMDMGAAGVSVGSVFIATHESNVSDEYKQAIIEGGASDIILTKRISGVPMTVIKTSYIKSIGDERSWLERKLKKRKRTRRVLRKALAGAGLNRYQHYVVGPDYQKVFCAGPSIARVNKVHSVKDVVQRIAGANAQ